ncbi:MAG: CCA tRNA nucleotidyltransferase [Gemmatimonadota bacterium]
MNSSTTEQILRLSPPVDVVDIARQLEGAGFETWCVGGAVRDALLGIPHLDWDLATAATPQQMRRVFGRVVPVGEEFGTLGIFGDSGRMHEVTTFRRDVRTDGRHAEVEFGASLDEDLSRRDFTINAIAWSPARERMHDPFGGRADLDARIIRAVGDPAHRMQEDRLRALRGLRFAARFGFEIDPPTWKAIAGSAGSLGALSQERIQQELVKTIDQVRKPGAALGLWRTSGALEALLPMLADAPQWRFAALDCTGTPDRSTAAQVARRRRLVRLAVLFAGNSAEEAEKCLRHLRFPTRDSSLIAERVRAAQALSPAVDAAAAVGGPNDGTLREWAAIAGRLTLADALRVIRATDAALRGDDRDRSIGWHALFRRAIRIAWRDPVELADLAVDGEDLQKEFGVGPGRLIGDSLRSLLRWVIEDPSRNSRDKLVARARELKGMDSGS